MSGYGTTGDPLQLTPARSLRAELAPACGRHRQVDGVVPTHGGDSDMDLEWKLQGFRRVYHVNPVGACGTGNRCVVRHSSQQT